MKPCSDFCDEITLHKIKVKFIRTESRLSQTDKLHGYISFLNIMCKMFEAMEHMRLNSENCTRYQIRPEKFDYRHWNIVNRNEIEFDAAPIYRVVTSKWWLERLQKFQKESLIMWWILPDEYWTAYPQRAFAESRRWNRPGLQTNLIFQSSAWWWLSRMSARLTSLVLLGSPTYGDPRHHRVQGHPAGEMYLWRVAWALWSVFQPFPPL